MNGLCKAPGENILITGVTGFIGRHVLYECLQELCSNQRPGMIYVLIRDKGDGSCESRLRSLLKCDYIPDYLQQFSEDDLFRKIQIIEGALGDDDLAQRIHRAVPSNNKLYVVHAAASVNLFNNDEAEADIIENNYKGTLGLLRSLQSYACKFIYISTAFSCGIVDGVIGNNYSLYYENEKFRNPYERYKNLIEKTVINHCAQAGLDYQILRPSIVVGRLMDAPLYYVSKFDVIYGWTKFFWHMNKSSSDDVIRIKVEKNSKINLVPVDYVAKIIRTAMYTDVKALNIVYPRSILSHYWCEQMLQTIGFRRYTFVEDMPEKMNKSEKMYYRVIDKVFSPYLTNISNEYDTSELNEIQDYHGYDPVDSIDFSGLARFAMEYDFDESKLPGNPTELRIIRSGRGM